MRDRRLPLNPLDFPERLQPSVIAVNDGRSDLAFWPENLRIDNPDSENHDIYQMAVNRTLIATIVTFTVGYNMGDLLDHVSKASGNDPLTLVMVLFGLWWVIGKVVDLCFYTRRSK